MKRAAVFSSLGVGALAHGLVLYPTLRRNCDWFGPVATRFETPRREIWLTIDDGPDARDTPSLLDLLAGHSAKATFFMIGRKVEAHRDLTWRVHCEGHEIGNHTYSHPSARFWSLGSRATRREIERGSDAILVATGRIPALFRSPVGMTNPHVHPALGDQRLVGWSVSGLDGLGDRGEIVVERLMRGVTPGAILVLHEGGAPGRIETLARLLTRLSDDGYRCVIPAAPALR
ncbi:MAG: polysaccharide deacetylase family protein [Terrimicrobiaceae bacterium]|nr:polysaccharide deacetylase family protein [Terrimicrobiaceae bacterium]